MYTTMCSILLAASSSLTTGQYCYPGGCNDVGYPGPCYNNYCDDGYGRYGMYGGYGSYGSRFGGGCCPGYGCGVGIGPFCGQNIFPGQSFPYAQVPSSLPPHLNQDQRMAELLKSYDEKIRNLEKLVLESGDSQMKQYLEAAERRWADKLAEVAKVQPVSTDFSQQLRAMEERLESSFAAKLDRAKKDEERLIALQSNIAVLAQTLADNSKNNEPLAKSLGDIADAIKAGKSTAPNLHAWALPPNRGLIVVYLPKEAKLFVNGSVSPPGKEVRSFISPVVELGKRYFYTLRMEVERDGKSHSDSREVYFEPGREVHVDFNQIEPAAGSAPPPPPPPPPISNKE